MPELRWLTPIYHPNISEIGMVCLGGYGTHWVPSLHLDELCGMLWDMARYHNYDIRSPYNREAALWVANQTDVPVPARRPPAPRPPRRPGPDRVRAIARGPRRRAAVAARVAAEPRRAGARSGPADTRVRPQVRRQPAPIDAAPSAEAGRRDRSSDRRGLIILDMEVDLAPAPGPTPRATRSSSSSRACRARCDRVRGDGRMDEPP